MSDAKWLGADPGGRDKKGKGCFGVAALSDDGSVVAATVCCVDEAVEWFISESRGVQPLGIGVDAPLWWSSGVSADRLADQWIRSTYKIASGTVQTANSLRGAALVQGPMLVHRVREHFREIRVTETHPKALLKALSVDWTTFGDKHGVTAGQPDEHDRDAVISAVCAREGSAQRWRDLSTMRGPSEQDPRTHWLGPLHYFWPETLRSVTRRSPFSTLPSKSIALVSAGVSVDPGSHARNGRGCIE